MLKYLNTQIGFQEIPEEISLEIYITGCRIRCRGCFLRELWEDTGTPLTTQELDRLLDENKGVTCCLLMGGERDIDYLTFLFQHIYGRVKTAWYSGLDMLPKDKQGILQYLDFYKEGHYDAELGGLDSPTTNQKLWSIRHREADHCYGMWSDITYKLQRKQQ